MRIAIVGPTHPYKGGVAQHTTELAHRLTAAGHDVTLESWSAQYPERLYPGMQRVSEPEGVPYAGTEYPLSWRRPDSWVRLGRRLRREADAVILVLVTPIQAPAYLTMLRALQGRRRGAADGSRRRRPPVVALCHNVLPHERRSIDESLTRALLRRATAVLVHGPAEAAQAAALTTAPIFSSPLPPFLFLTADRTAPVDPDWQPARRLLFFGLVRPYKGLDVLLRALALGPPDVRLTVAGEFWGGTDETARLLAELGIADRVDLRPGYLPAAEVPALVGGSDALVLPYRTATGSQHVRLAHLYGVPVVATRVGPLPEQVRDGVDGLLVPPDDPPALAAALRRLYEPGVLAALRAKVEPPDDSAEWAPYLVELSAALAVGAPVEPAAAQ